MARWIQWVTSSWNIGTDWSPIVIICRWFRLSHNWPRWWVLPMYRSSSKNQTKIWSFCQQAMVTMNQKWRYTIKECRESVYHVPRNTSTGTCHQTTLAFKPPDNLGLQATRQPWPSSQPDKLDSTRTCGVLSSILPTAIYNTGQQQIWCLVFLS